MNQQHDILRISDSRGNVHAAPIALQRTIYEMGSDRRRKDAGDGYIVLPGSGIAPLHARLRRLSPSGLWQLEVLSSGHTRLGDDPLETGDVRMLDHGRDLWIGNNYLQLICLDLNKRVRQGNGGLSDMEQSLSLELLEYEERNRADFQNADTNTREGILSNRLDVMIDTHMARLTRDTLFVYCQEALRRLLVARCLTSGSPGDVPLNYSRLNVDQLRRSQAIRQDYIARLRLDILPKTTSLDIERVQAGIAAVHAELGVDIEEYMQRLLVKDAAREAVLGLVFRLGPIQFLLDTPNINEIMVSGHERVFVEKAGRMFDTGLPFASERDLRRIAEAIAAKDGKSLTQMETMVDARLEDGSRANIVISPTARQGTAITIRKFSKKPFTLEGLVERRSLSREMLVFLQACVLSRRNILISGGTGTGKTTLLNALSQSIPASERVVTIEDTAELALANKNLVSMEGRPSNAEGLGEISIKRMLRNALRMRPDRIIVGECRGEETLDMLQAMNTGHEGSMTTAHANSPADLLLRLETMVAQSGIEMPVYAIRQQIAAAIDLIVQVRRTPPLDGSDADGAFQRTVTEICELGTFDPDTGEIEVYPIFEFIPDAELPRFAVSGYIPSFFDDLVRKDLIDIKALFGRGDAQ